MKNYFLLIISLFFICQESLSQPLTELLYVKASIGLNNNFSSNSNVNITDNQFYMDNSNEVISSAVGGNYSLCAGVEIGKNFFLETGYGNYTITQSHKIPSGGPLYTYGYKNVNVSSRYHQIPLLVGYYFIRNDVFKFGNYIGGHYLFNLISTEQIYKGQEKLNNKRNNPYEGKYSLLPNKLNWSTILFNLGLNAEYTITPRFSIDGSLGVVMGFRTVTNSGIFIYQNRETYTAQANSFSSTKGDAIAFRIGLKYSPWGKK